MHANLGYEGIKAPKLIRHRYIFEDVPYSLVPIAYIGHQYGVDTTCIHSIVNLANIVYATDFWRTGRTLERLGIEAMSVAELNHYMETGER